MLALKKSLTVMIFLLISPAVFAAVINTHLDRNPVYLDESFRIIYESDGSVDSSPDFSPLVQIFDIINRSQGTSMQIINGQVSNKTQWTLTLLAKQDGTFVIPAIRFGRDQSQAVSITVKPPRQGQSADVGDISLEVTAEPKTAYVQSQIIYTVQLLRAVSLTNASLSEPEFSDGDAIVEKLGDDREYETLRNGVRYAVIERIYAIFPQQSGNLKIKPIIFEGQIANRTRSVFDPFAQTSSVKRLLSKPVELKVMPMPQNVQGSYWLPAQDLQLDEEWPEPLVFKSGEPVTRTITLKAKGLTAAQLPEINSEVPDSIKLYPDQPALNDDKQSNKIIGTRQEKIAMIPSQQGDFILPTIEIPWWNTIKDRQQVARIPQRTIHVVAAESSNTTTATSATIGSDTTESATSGHDSEVKPVVANDKGPVFPGYWFWVSVVLAIGWLLTVIRFFMIRKPTHTDTEEKKEQAESLSRIKRNIKQACLNDAANDAKTSLLEWARYHWQADPPKNLGEIGKRCGGVFANEINTLNQALYSKDVGQWKGGGLWQAFEHYTSSIKTEKTPSGDILVPLYP